MRGGIAHIKVRGGSGTTAASINAAFATSQPMAFERTFIAISPIAQEALLHTEMYAGSNWTESTRRYSPNLGRNWSMHALARSPTRAYADWRTSGTASRMQTSKADCSLRHTTKTNGRVMHLAQYKP